MSAQELNIFDIAVIGGGASGMMAAISAARLGAKVILFEKMERVGRKVRITGKGRCNITNTKDWGEFSTHIYPDSKFLKPSFFAFSNSNTIKFFNDIGLETVVERGDRVFPASGLAQDVVDALHKEIIKQGVKLLLNSPVSGFERKDGVITGVVTNGKVYRSKSVILATGGLSYPSTGSTGDGYLLAKDTGHKIEKCMPSLTALMPDFYKAEVAGVNLKNVQISLIVNNDIVQQEMGELEFTNNGIEGSIGYKVSRRAVKAIVNGNKCQLSIDLKPALSIDLLKKRVERELTNINNGSVEDLLKKLLPAPIIRYFTESNRLPNSIKREGNSNAFSNLVAEKLKSWNFAINSFTAYERAVVTAGGVSLESVISKNLKSRYCNNLFFCGELLDLDGDTGGYNLQIAFSTGFNAGKSAFNYINSSE